MNISIQLLHPSTPASCETTYEKTDQSRLHVPGAMHLWRTQSDIYFKY